MLATLSKYDSKTASSILAAAALATSTMPGLDDDFAGLREFQPAATALLKEIRQSLSIGEGDDSQGARTSIDEYIARALDDTLLGNDADRALIHAGQVGRISPALYKVVQSERFQKQFYKFGIRKDAVEDAIHRPDDFQHLMPLEGPDTGRDALSLFMKRVPPRKKLTGYWLVVQAVRQGISQIVQSAWRVYPEDVDLADAYEPIHVMRAFARVFGRNVEVGEMRDTLIDTIHMPITPMSNESTYAVKFWTTGQWFASWSQKQTKNPSVLAVGLVYCIDLDRYGASLKRHGIS